MGLFKDLVGLGKNVQWALSIDVDDNERLHVTVRLTAGHIKNTHADKLPALNFNGTPEEFDDGFIAALSGPTAKVVAFFSNCKQFDEELETAKKEQEAEREKNRQKAKDKATTSKEELEKKKEQEANAKKFETAMKKALDLEKAEKYGQAIGAMPKAKDFPDFIPQIDAKMKELRRKHGGFDFSEPQEPAGQPVSTASTSLSSQTDPAEEHDPSTETDEPVDPVDPPNEEPGEDTPPEIEEPEDESPAVAKAA